MDMWKRERKGLLPLPPLGPIHHFYRKKNLIFFFFGKITIRVKQGQKQLISLNEQRYFRD